MVGQHIKLLNETVEYFDYGDYARAVVSRTDPETGKKIKVEEYALTLHAIMSSLYGPNGKVAAAERLRKRLEDSANVTKLRKDCG